MLAACASQGEVVTLTDALERVVASRVALYFYGARCSVRAVAIPASAACIEMHDCMLLLLAQYRTEKTLAACEAAAGVVYHSGFARLLSRSPNHIRDFSVTK